MDPSAFQPGTGAPSPPPPPPPAAPPAAVPAGPHGAPAGAGGLAQLSAQIRALLSRIQVLEREAQEQRAWRAQANQLLQQAGDGQGSAPLAAAQADAGPELEEMVRLYEEQRARVAELEEENQRLRHMQQEEEAEEAPAPIDLSDLPIVKDPAIEAKLRELAETNSRLQSELAKMRKSATAKFKRLKDDLETIENQKKNLLQALEARDAAEPDREITLEEITGSEVFRSMLDNIKTTSRQEVTLLHDAIRALGKIDPKAYNAALTVVARTFEKAKVENPLALLPRAPE